MLAHGVWLSLVATTLVAQELPPQPQRLLDLPSTLHDQGVDVSLATLYESTFAGAANDESATSAQVQLLDLGLDVDLARQRLLPDTTLHLAVSQRFGDTESVGADALQGSSGLDAPNGSLLYGAQFTYQPNESFRLSGGLIDSNETFAAIDATGEFFHASAGTTPTILGMPTWPDTALGAQFTVTMPAGFEASFGAFRAVPRTAELQQPSALTLELPRRQLDRGIFSIAELGIRPNRGDYRIGIGAWHDSSNSERLDGAIADSSTGAYAVWEHLLFDREPFGADVFATLGWTQAELTDAATHAMIGLRIRSPLQSRPDDRFGLLASVVGPNLLADGGTETVLEAYYRIRVADRMDMQFGAIHTRAATAQRDSVVFGLRFSYEF